MALLTAVLASGASGLTWEVLWQHHTSLALGVSAFGTAVTLASMMAGLGIGGLIAAWLARSGRLRRPLVGYGVAELGVGLGGVLVPGGLAILASLDTSIYALSAPLAGIVRIAGTVALLLLPAMAMGATLPFLAPCALQLRTNIAVVYAINLLGAVAGVMGATFLAIPVLGVDRTGWLTAGINLAVAVWALSRREEIGANSSEARAAWPPLATLGLAFTSGLAIFILEVSWFRSLRAALTSTTQSFALILASFLIALAAGSALASALRFRFPDALRFAVPLAALAVFCATPAVDQIDRFAAFQMFSVETGIRQLALLLGIVCIPVTLLGTILPWLLAEHQTTAGVGRLYAVNTLGSVLGALAAGFVLLPSIGSTYTSWLAAAVLLVAGGLRSRTAASLAGIALCGAVGVAAASYLGGPTARLRVQGSTEQNFEGVLYVSEGPDSTVWVTTSRSDGSRQLVIDGFVASSEGLEGTYMRWMGHLPALAVPRLREALVICFGTGQTADAVRQHHPDLLHVVDVNAAVFDAADLFASNHGVLEDRAVDAVVMDGRAFLRRRNAARYDLVTLEPMPPNSAGTNNLYSLEFYELIRERLATSGVAAQWLPLHLLAPEHMKAIVATFHAVFPYTRLWIEPRRSTGILVGGTQPWALRASEIPLSLSGAQIRRHFVLGWDQVASLSRHARLISDDNQLLSFGYDRLTLTRGRGADPFRSLALENLEIIRRHRR
jgi:spermidine synthase